MSDKKMITIFNQRLCGYLQMKGFVLVGMAENKHCAGKNVFFFNDTDELRKAIKEFKDNKVTEQVTPTLLFQMYKETNNYG